MIILLRGFVVFVCSFMAGARATALAQDVNIQSTIDTLAPEPSVQATAPKRATKQVPELRPLSVQEMSNELKLKNVSVPSIASVRTAGDVKALRSLYEDATKKSAFVPTGKTKTVDDIGTPKLTTEVSLISRYVFDSNPSLRNSNVISSGLWFNNPNVVTKYQDAKATTAVSLAISGTVLRYDRAAISDKDILAATLTHATTLRSIKHEPGSETKLDEVFRARISSRSIYEPGPGASWHNSTRWAREWTLLGIALSPAKCESGGKYRHCLTGSVTMDMAYNFYESVHANNNFTVFAKGSVAWFFGGPYALTWTTSATITDRYYDRAGGRNDVAFAGDTKLAWKPMNEVELSASVAYTSQVSTLDPAEFQQYQFWPQIRAAVTF